MPSSSSLVAIGTSGWNYPRGRGAWTGVVYPPQARGRRFDELAWYAERFRTVEVNVSFCYNYLYSADELTPFAKIAEAARALGRKLYLYTNNHFAGNAVANAAQLRGRLDDPVAAPFPRTFVDRFPGIERVVETERADTLF